MDLNIEKWKIIHSPVGNNDKDFYLFSKILWLLLEILNRGRKKNAA